MTTAPTGDLADGTTQWTAREVAAYLGYTGRWAATSANTTLRRHGILAIPGVTRTRGGGAAKVYDATEVVARLSPQRIHHHPPREIKEISHGEPNQRA